MALELANLGPAIGGEVDGSGLNDQHYYPNRRYAERVSALGVELEAAF